MVKHFEHLWEEAEKFSIQNKQTIPVIVKEISNDINLFEISSNIEDSSQIFGRVLYNLCALSQQLNVNTFTSLLKELNNQKIEVMEEE